MLYYSHHSLFFALYQEAETKRAVSDFFCKFVLFWGQFLLCLRSICEKCILMSDKVALIEVGGSHDECLYPQVAFLQASGFCPVVIITDRLQKRFSLSPGVRCEVLPHAISTVEMEVLCISTAYRYPKD